MNTRLKPLNAQGCPKQNYFGKALKELRRENNMTEEQLAEKTGITTEKLLAFENGDERPDPTTISSLATAMEISPFEIFNRSILKAPFFKGMTQEDLDKPIADDDIAELYALIEKSEYAPSQQLVGEEV